MFVERGWVVDGQVGSLNINLVSLSSLKCKYPIYLLPLPPPHKALHIMSESLRLSMSISELRRVLVRRKLQVIPKQKEYGLWKT